MVFCFLQISCVSFFLSACLIFVFGLSDGWIGSGAPIFPMKGRFDRVVQLLVHGYHWPISSHGGLSECWGEGDVLKSVAWYWLWDRLVACMTEELHHPLAGRSLDWRELCVSIPQGPPLLQFVRPKLSPLGIARLISAIICYCSIYFLILLVHA